MAIVLAALSDKATVLLGNYSAHFCSIRKKGGNMAKTEVATSSGATVVKANFCLLSSMHSRVEKGQLTVLNKMIKSLSPRLTYGLLLQLSFG